MRFRKFIVALFEACQRCYVCKFVDCLILQVISGLYFAAGSALRSTLATDSSDVIVSASNSQ